MAKKKSRLDFMNMKKNGEKLTWVTAYDFPMASLPRRGYRHDPRGRLLDDYPGVPGHRTGHDGRLHQPLPGGPQGRPQHLRHGGYALRLIPGLRRGRRTERSPLPEGGRYGLHQA